MKGFGKNLMIWAVLFIVLIGIFNAFSGSAGRGGETDLTYGEFLAAVDSGRVASVTIRGTDIHGEYADGGTFQTTGNVNAIDSLQTRLADSGVNFKFEEEGSFLTTLLIYWGPMILIIFIWLFVMRQMQGGGGRGGAMGFGKSKARLLNEAHGRVTFDDVAGIDEAKEELEEIVEFLKDPHKFQRLGGKIPKGALLVGSPGTGKTLLARAIAGEAGVPFFTISGSDFVEMFVGVGASRVRDMFEQAKKHAPCIIFIDEIDAVGRHRGAGLGGGNDEREQTLNQLLVEMDGFEANEGIILVAATNRPDVLDPALLRPGRFDRQVVVPLPDIIGREKILEVHMRKVPLAPDVNPRVIARGSPGFSGADLANLVNEAALLAARKGKRLVSMAEFEEAKDKVMMGSERRSMVMTDDEKKLTAYHEAGHALVSINCEHTDPIHKATIIPRGRALGMVMSLPERDEYSQSRAKMHDRLAVLMGGRVAEEIIFGHDAVTSGASSDIKVATNMARRMVTEYGMSDKLGPLRYSSNEDEVFLGHSVARQQNMSEDTANLIDAEVRAFVDNGLNRATEIIKTKIDDLHTIAKAMLEYETVTGEELKTLLAGGSIDRKDDGKGGGGSKPTIRSSVPTAGPKAKKKKTSGDAGPEPQPEG